MIPSINFQIINLQLIEMNNYYWIWIKKNQLINQHCIGREDTKNKRIEFLPKINFSVYDCINNPLNSLAAVLSYKTITQFILNSFHLICFNNFI